MPLSNSIQICKLMAVSTNVCKMTLLNYPSSLRIIESIGIDFIVTHQNVAPICYAVPLLLSCFWKWDI